LVETVLVLGLDPNFPAQPEICFRRNPCAQKKADLKVGPLRSPNDAGYVQHL